MTITYEFGDGLYVNLTNRCDCACVFCIRKSDSEAIFHHDLWLPQEPKAQDVLDSILEHDLSNYAELVFCGFGEPSYRTDDILWICDQLRAQCAALPPIRLNTNGHGSMLLGRNLAPEFTGRIDCISVSLNGATPEEYCENTRPQAGEAAFYAMLDFVRECSKTVPEVVLTVVDFEKTQEDLDPCRKLASDLGAILRIRAYSEA